MIRTLSPAGNALLAIAAFVPAAHCQIEAVEALSLTGTVQVTLRRRQTE